LTETTFQTARRFSMPSSTDVRTAWDWGRLLHAYARPDDRRAALELGLTAALFALFWSASAWAVRHAVPALPLMLVPAAGFLARLFVIQHDCGHRAFFVSRRANDWCGRLIGVVTFTPYAMWRRNHAIHHTTSGNLARRRDSDIRLLTVAEYRALTPLGRFGYRAYRHPLTLFVFGPAWVFLLKYRAPIDLRTATRADWASAFGTNLAMSAAVVLLGRVVGVWTVLAVQVPIVYLTAMLGVWMFYVQHQYEATHWAEAEAWDLLEAALEGSSHYDLPAPLAWITGNIGVHNVHHLSSRIPFYRLPEVLRDHPALAAKGRIGLAESLGCARLSLWDERRRRLVPAAEVRNRASGNDFATEST
jgi:omega-6 fatty acid desaturase (delta-12 desaturase)